MRHFNHLRSAARCKFSVSSRLAFFLVALLVAIATAPSVHADTFGSGANAFEIEFVNVGNPGNPDDTGDGSGYAGGVSYAFQIGTYEISEAMINAANALGNLGITHTGRGPNMPASDVSWFEAATFVNWLNTSQGHTPAYKFDEQGAYQVWEPEDEGYDPDNLFRNSQAHYFLPSTDEWYKAAYYDASAGVYYDYPTQSDAVPDGIDFVGDTEFEAVFYDGASNPMPNVIDDVGVVGPYDTFGQGGNISEWLESAFNRNNNHPEQHRGTRGGGWTFPQSVLVSNNSGIGIGPAFEGGFLGIRVAAVPEPSSLLLLGIGLFMVYGYKRVAPTFVRRSLYHSLQQIRPNVGVRQHRR